MVVGAISTESAPSGVGSRLCRARGRFCRSPPAPIYPVVVRLGFLFLGLAVFRPLSAGAGCDSISSSGLAVVSSDSVVCVGGGVSGCVVVG